MLAKLATWYTEAADDSRRDLQLGGQPVAWADPTPRGAAGSVQTTNRIRLGLDRPALDGVDPADASDTLRALGRPAFYPAVDAAWVVDQSSTTALGGDPPEVEVSVALRWLEHALDPAENADLGYLDLVGGTPPIPTGACFQFTWEPKVRSFPTSAEQPTFVVTARHVHLARCPVEWYISSDGSTGMIASFRDAWLRAFFMDDVRSRRIAADLEDRLFRKLQMIDDAATDQDLRVPPSNHFEKLRGNLAGFHSIRVNNQWRLNLPMGSPPRRGV